MNVLKIMLEAQKDNQNVAIEIKMVQIATYFASAKNSAAGHFSRETWLLVRSLILEFVELLSTKTFSMKKQSSTSPAQADIEAENEEKKDEGGDLDAFNQSSEA